MKIIDLINLYRLSDITRIEIRKNNWFVLEAEKINIPDYINNKEVEDFCFNNDKLVINYVEDEIEEVEDKEYEYIKEISLGTLNEQKQKNRAFKDTINALIRNQKIIIERLNK